VSERDWLSGPLRAAGTERALQTGQTLFRQGARTAGLYQVVRGKIRLARFDRSGREVVLHSASDGETFAEASLFSPTYHCDAIATTDTVVRLYPKPLVLAALQSDPQAARAFMVMLARQVMNLRTNLEQRSIRSARDRVRHHLALNLAADGETVPLPGSLKDLAARLGLTHEALYRTLSQMESDGEIERLEGKIRVLGSSYDPDHR
jgi:CRP-like cAMP-binding protein